MDTCHYCHEVVEKLNLEYDSLYAENERQKRIIADLERENASHRVQIEFAQIFNDIITATMNEGFDCDRKLLHDVLSAHNDVIVQNRTWSWDEEGENFDDDDPTHIPFAYCPEYLSAKEMLRLVKRSNRRNLWRSNPRLDHVA